MTTVCMMPAMPPLRVIRTVVAAGGGWFGGGVPVVVTGGVLDEDDEVGAAAVGLSEAPGPATGVFPAHPPARAVNATTAIHRDVFDIGELSPLRARTDITPSRRLTSRHAVRVSDLSSAWRATLPSSAPAAAVARVGDDLLARWNEPQRRYHNVAHLAAVLRIVGEHAERASDPVAVRLAAWYHDAVYDPQRVDNEEASALLAESVLATLDVPPAQVAEVARLVRLTATHDPIPGDRNGGLLTDADLAILAADPETYQNYTQAVRAEYAFVPDAAFAQGRADVLHHLLALPRLFHTPVLRDRWEEAARANITHELTVLRRAAAPPAPAI
jgi:predicted metal-dependent HD superfamily phosphohydrolase